MHAVRGVWIVWLATFCLAASQANGAEPWNVQDVVRIALENHPSLKAARARVDQADAAHGKVWEMYAPKVSLYGGAQQNEVDGETTTTVSSGGLFGDTSTVSQDFSESDTRLIFGGSVDQHLLDFGNFTGQRASAAATHEARLAALESQRLEVTAQAKIGYYNLLRANRLLQYNRETVQRRQQRVDWIETRVRQGRLKKRDLTQAQVDLANARVQLARSQSDLTEAEAEFLAAIGKRDREGHQLVDDVTLKSISITLEDAVQRALETRPELERKKHEIEAQEAQVQAVQGSYLPSLSAFLGASSLNTTGDDNEFDQLTVFTGGLRVHVPFTWLLTRGRKGQARAALQELKANDLETRQSVALSVNRTYTTLFEAVERTKITRKLTESAMENWKTTQAAYRRGQASIYDSTDAHNFLYNSRVSFLEALYDAKIAEVRLERAIGTEL